MQLQEFINQLPPGEQARVRRLLQEYNSAVNPQDRALAQRRLEPYTRAMMQSPDLRGTRNFLDRAAREKYLKTTIGREIPKPIPARFPESNLTPDKLIGSGQESPQIRSLERLATPGPPVTTAPPVSQMGPSPTAGPTARIADTSSFNYGTFPVNPAPPAVQPTAVPPSLLDPDTEESSFFDDPMRMGLLQAGLGLMSAPRYSTNPNDVTFSSGLARGLGGFIEGYGGTRQRLTEEERQRLKDDYQRSVRDFNQRYMQTQMDATQSRLDNEEETITQKVLRQQEEEKEKQAIIADILTAEPNATATRKSALNRMSLEELNAERSVYYPSAAVRQQQGQEELARNRLAELTGQPASIYEGQSLEKLNAEILKQSEPKPKENLFGDSVQAQAAQKLIDAGADPVEVAERILEGKPTTQVIEMPVDKTDPLQGTKQVLLNKNTLEMQDIPGSVVLPSKKDIPAADARLYNKFQVTFDQINQSIALLSDEDAVKGVGFFQGNAPSLMIPAKAKELRALLADLTTDRLNEKFGAALTKQEYDRIKPAVPLETDSEETLQVKLNTLKNIFRNKMGLLEQQYPSNRFRPFPNIDAIGLKGYNEAMGN